MGKTLVWTELHSITCTFACTVVDLLGTCAIKPREHGGVVDASAWAQSCRPAHRVEKCRREFVRDRLRVIGEKDAVIIAEELGTKDVV